MASEPSKKIVLVEDNDLNMKLFRDLLSANFKDAELICTYEGLDGLRLIRKHMPDLTLVDIQLPEISGMEIARQIRADRQLKDLNVIAIPSELFFGYDLEYRSVFDDYIAKPFSVPRFLDTVRKNLDSPSSPLERKYQRFCWQCRFQIFRLTRIFLRTKLQIRMRAFLIWIRDAFHWR